MQHGLQGLAVKEAVYRAGGSSDGMLPFPVCKKAFAPFSSSRSRLYGCHFHSGVRARALEGVVTRRKKEWEPFSQFVLPRQGPGDQDWSLIEALRSEATHMTRLRQKTKRKSVGRLKT